MAFGAQAFFKQSAWKRDCLDVSVACVGKVAFALSMQVHDWIIGTVWREIACDVKRKTFVIVFSGMSLSPFHFMLCAPDFPADII